MGGLKPGEAVISVLSFEGPDLYARAGGLAVRVSHLTETLAQRGFRTHLFFVGAPDAPSQEDRWDGRLILHRWCQWISRYHPMGVYDGEEGKRQDFIATVPPYLLEHVIRPALEAGQLPVILAEEWHTAEAVIHLDELLRVRGWRDRCVILWNANNTMSFHRIDWGRLREAAQLTTVSRYMKHLMWNWGVNPLVIPNGIPCALLEPVPPEQIAALRQALGVDERTVMLFKVGRFDPAKRWLLAVEAAAQLKAMGYRVVFPLRGGVEPHGQEVFAHAQALGLRVAHLLGSPTSWEGLLQVLHEAPPADLYSLEFPLRQEWLRPFYAAADAVLANSGHEPFGLTGLEAMAAGGIVFTGATGEEYALDGQGAIVLDTDRPEEIVLHLLDLRAEPGRMEACRAAARRRAADFTWPRVLEILLEKVSFIARTSGALPWPKPVFGRPDGRVRDVVIYTIVHQPRRLRLPAQPLPRGAPAALLAQGLFDEEMNARYFRRAAQRCYYPTIARFQAMLDAGFRLAIGFSLTFLEQARRWDEELLDRFRDLVRHPNVELVAAEPRHSMLLLWDLPRFIQRMQWAADQLEHLFGVRPRIADTTEMMMSPSIYHALDQAGFAAAFLDGRPWILEWRQPTYLYHHDGGRMKLLARHYQLSDDVGYRFSNRSWEGWPLLADRYAEWLAQHLGDFIVLGWDFETFGEHHWEETGIFAFLEALPGEVMHRGLSFRTPSEIVARYGACSYELPLPAFPSTWAGSGGLEFFLGNEVQQAVFRLMMEAYHMACLTGDPELIELSLYLAQSDNLHMLQWVGRFGPEAEVSAYFTPAEWWAMGWERIVWEVQQVYKNFIAALEIRPG